MFENLLVKQTRNNNLESLIVDMQERDESFVRTSICQDYNLNRNLIRELFFSGKLIFKLISLENINVKPFYISVTDAVDIFDIIYFTEKEGYVVKEVVSFIDSIPEEIGDDAPAAGDGDDAPPEDTT